MKRFFFTVIALAAVAVSCTKGGLLESPQTYSAPMTFEPYTGRVPVTKATVAKNETIRNLGFQVVGFKETNSSNTLDTSPYMYREVKYSSTDSKWYYDIDAYWPDNSTEFTFLAYGLNAGVPAFTNATTDFTKIEFAVDDLVADQKDLVISPAIPDMCNETISVKLYHVLSRIGFKVDAKGSGVNLIIKDIKLSGKFITSAEFDLTDAVTVTEDGEGEDKTVVVTYANDATMIVDGEETHVTGDTEMSYSLFDTEYEAGSPLGENDSYPAFLMTSNNTPHHIYPNYEFGKSFNLDATNLQVPDYLDEVDADGNPTAAANRYMMIIPQTVEDATITIVYELPGIDEVELPISLGDQKFEAGKAYEFLFTVSTQAVKFGVIVNQWDDPDGDGEIEVDSNSYKEFPLN